LIAGRLYELARMYNFVEAERVTLAREVQRLKEEVKRLNARLPALAS
jgi:hypothetical protein